ncbi:hypothetical protein V8C34DRAFT_286478 [Trichoderma compactum]
MRLFVLFLFHLAEHAHSAVRINPSMGLSHQHHHQQRTGSTTPRHRSPSARDDLMLRAPGTTHDMNRQPEQSSPFQPASPINLKATPMALARSSVASHLWRRRSASLAVGGKRHERQWSSQLC